MTQVEEKRASFYLGKRFEPNTGVLDEPIHYEARHLTTHGVCVGMTGSGKTGLCLSLLEEAALDGIPILCIDPKGDLGNLLLTFPDLAPTDFEPWIDAADAQRHEQSVAERSESIAALWKNGLAKWGQDGERIRRFRDAVDLSIYTPGSSAGLPISVLKGLNAPSEDADRETVRERVLATVSGLLALVGVDADPVQSREHVFLSTIVHRAWDRGENLAIGELVRAILEPPFNQIGVLDVEAFYPAKARASLAMKLNSLLASPSFAAWLEGEPLDIQKLLFTEHGKPRISILSIAHLSDAERMFFVTIFLGELVAWMRDQPGTTGLRALLYMDEVVGFLPPVAEPPSKKPLMTLLKQARAFGVGCLLATQNPVDVDYKALSNCGTWFLGRLQTERDVDRVIDGLSGAAQIAGQSLNPQAIRATLAGLKSRVFLMNNVHEGAPQLFHSRWALSYLRGPLTRRQIGTLMADKKQALLAGVDKPSRSESNAESNAEPVPQPTPNPPKTADATMIDNAAAVASGAAVAVVGTATAGTGAATTEASRDEDSGPTHTTRPIIPDHIEEIFLDGDGTHYEPALLAWVELHYTKAHAHLDHWFRPLLLAPLTGETPSELWADAETLSADITVRDLAQEGLTFSEVPRGILGKAALRSSKAALKAYCYGNRPVILGRCRALKLWSRIDEDREEFGSRFNAALMEDLEKRVGKVFDTHAKRIEKVKAKLEKAHEKLHKEEAQVSQHQMDTGISIGTAMIGAMFGQGSASGHARRAASSARRAQRVGKEKEDVRRVLAKITALEAELKAAEDAGNAALDFERKKSPPPIEEVQIAPKKSDIGITRLVLAWVPR